MVAVASMLNINKFISESRSDYRVLKGESGQEATSPDSSTVINDSPAMPLQTRDKLSSKFEILGVFSSVLSYMILSSEERQKRLDEFHKKYDENVLDENLKKEKTRVNGTLSHISNREMILADECLIRGDESGAAVYSHIANVIHARQRNNES